MIGDPRASRGYTRNRAVPVHAFGRLLQIVGLAAPPLSIFLQLVEAITLGQMLTMLVAAVACFFIGRIVEGYTR